MKWISLLHNPCKCSWKHLTSELHHGLHSHIYFVCLFVCLLTRNVKFTGYKRGAVIHEGILCKVTNVVQNSIPWIFMFHNKPCFPSHVKVITSFSMCFGKDLVVVASTTRLTIASHVVILFIYFFQGFFVCFFLW